MLTTLFFQFLPLPSIIWNVTPLWRQINWIQWFQDNVPTVNYEKTQPIHFGLRIELSNGFSILLDEAVDHLSRGLRFLGVNFDEGLGFRGHVKRVTMKFNSGIL